MKEGICKAGAMLDRVVLCGAIWGGAFRCGGPLYVHGENMTYPLPDISLHVVLYWKGKIVNIGWIMVIYQLLDVSDIDAHCIGKQTTQVILQ